MKKTVFLLYLVILINLLYGCASVQIYSNTDLRNRTGLKFYTAKPYLLAEFRAEKDGTVKTSVIYLPDLANPQYIRVRPGIGSNELKMTFANGTLVSYGLTSDTKIAETINSLAGLIAKSSDAMKQIIASNNQMQQSAGGDSFILYELVLMPEGLTLKRVKVEE